jgi:aromatic-L-amino-acid decarboxylase
LKLWFVLRSYGVAKLRNFLRSHVKMAKVFEELVAMDKRFEIVVPRNFAMVCFRILPTAMGERQPKRPSHQNGNVDNGHKVLEEEEESSNEVNQKLLESINMSGRVFMTHAVVGNVYAIRFAVDATLVEERHVVMAWKVVQEHATAILSTN